MDISSYQIYYLDPTYSLNFAAWVTCENKWRLKIRTWKRRAMKLDLKPHLAMVDSLELKKIRWIRYFPGICCLFLNLYSQYFLSYIGVYSKILSKISVFFHIWSFWEYIFECRVQLDTIIKLHWLSTRVRLMQQRVLVGSMVCSRIVKTRQLWVGITTKKLKSMHRKRVCDFQCCSLKLSCVIAIDWWKTIKHACNNINNHASDRNSCFF